MSIYKVQVKSKCVPDPDYLETRNWVSCPVDFSTMPDAIAYASKWYPEWNVRVVHAVMNQGIVELWPVANENLIQKYLDSRLTLWEHLTNDR